MRDDRRRRRAGRSGRAGCGCARRQPRRSICLRAGRGTDDRAGRRRRQAASTPGSRRARRASPGKSTSSPPPSTYVLERQRPPGRGSGQRVAEEDAGVGAPASRCQLAPGSTHFGADGRACCRPAVQRRPQEERVRPRAPTHRHGSLSLTRSRKWKRVVQGQVVRRELRRGAAWTPAAQRRQREGDAPRSPSPSQWPRGCRLPRSSTNSGQRVLRPGPLTPSLTRHLGGRVPAMISGGSSSSPSGATFSGAVDAGRVTKKAVLLSDVRADPTGHGRRPSAGAASVAGRSCASPAAGGAPRPPVAGEIAQGSAWPSVMMWISRSRRPAPSCAAQRRAQRRPGRAGTDVGLQRQGLDGDGHELAVAG